MVVNHQVMRQQKIVRQASRWVVTVALVVGMVEAVPGRVGAQAHTAVGPTIVPAKDYTPAQDSLLRMPLQRPLAIPPTVEITGVLTQRDGAPATLPLSATLATADLDLYAAQFGSRFPRSQAVYPIDSIVRVQHERAQGWRDRLRALRAQAPAATAGWQLVYFAQTAARAGDDTLAKELFDTRLAQLRQAFAEQSYVLLCAVEAFADTSRDSAAIARTLPWAQTYATRLHALPASGYRTPNDSTSVLYRHIAAEHVLILAYDTQNAFRDVLTHAERLFAVAAPIAQRERGDAIERQFPFYVVYRAAGRQPDAAALIQAWNARIMAAELQMGRAIVAWMGMLGHPAFPIVYHRALNTGDSVYHDPPRTVALDNGHAHVIGFGRYDSLLPYVLARIQRQAPAGADVLFVMYNEGYRGIDLLDPREEAAWLERAYAQVRRVTIPIALWAPPKVPEGMGMLPPRSPVFEQYFAIGLPSICLVVDGHGIIRGWYDVSSRRQEAALVHDLALLGDSAAARVTVVPASTP